jgi:sialate O-acetylesterase
MKHIRVSWMTPALCALVIMHPFTATADVKLPALFSDHMVLQRDLSAPVWGWADAGEAVTVSIAGQSQSTKTAADGTWSIKLDKLKAGGPFTMVVKGNNALTIQDVLVGEVWLGSGQSNMALTVQNSQDPAKETASANFPKIRVFTVKRREAVTPQKDCEGQWILCSPETAGRFSAAAYFFGRDLHQQLGVPVGLITAAVGATPIEGWTSLPAQEGKKELKPVFRPWDEKLKVPYDDAAAQAQYQTRMEAWKQAAATRKAEGKAAGDPPEKPVHPREHKSYPANLFNGMIAPIIPYAIRGAIWYQGENNAQGEFSKLYATQLPLLIQDWRERWGQGDFPFAWVQLPNYIKVKGGIGAETDWAFMRESMLGCLSTVKNSGMAVTIDIGDPSQIHPKDKVPVGQRLALWARASVYGEKIPFSSPLPAGFKISGNEVTLSFTHTDGGLVARGGDLKGFVIAGADKKWFPAEARIAGDQVVVSSPEVKAPVAARYAWADNPDCNLYNGAGLPASPFRTDTW